MRGRCFLLGLLTGLLVLGALRLFPKHRRRVHPRPSVAKTAAPATAPARPVPPVIKPDPEERWKSMSLDAACDQEDTEVIRQHLRRGADPDTRDEEGQTRLMRASIRPSARTATALLDGGAAPNLRDTFGRTALSLALEWGDVQTIAALRRGGAREYPVRPEWRLVSRNFRDINGDGRRECIEILMVRGRRYPDDEPWCGTGEKWDGQFEARVRRGAHVLGSVPLLGGRSGELRLPRFRLSFGDYNSDGNLDFNIGQYAGCNGNQYTLYTIRQNGRVEPLPVAGRTEEGIFIFDHGNSTDDIRFQNGLMETHHYDNGRGQHVIEYWRWTGSRFVLARSDPPESSN